jgi:hypothetical protein
MKSFRFVDYLLDGDLCGAKAETGEDPPDVNIRRDVYGEVISELDFEIAGQDVRGHARNLWADTIKLKEAIDNLRASSLSDLESIIFM